MYSKSSDGGNSQATPRRGERLSKNHRPPPPENATCELCHTPFVGSYHRTNLRRHMRSVHGTRFKCTARGCDESFNRADNLRTHIRRHHPDEDVDTAVLSRLQESHALQNASGNTSTDQLKHIIDLSDSSPRGRVWSVDTGGEGPSPYGGILVESEKKLSNLIVRNIGACWRCRVMRKQVHFLRLTY